MDAPPTTGREDDRPVRWRRALALASLGPLAWGLLFLARANPEATERWYARGVYPWIRAGQAWGQDQLPGSATELLIVVALAWIALRVLRGLRALRADTRGLRNLGAHALAQSLALAGTLGMSFQLLWGLNHARPRLADLIDLPTGPVRVQELRGLVRALASQADQDRPAGLRGAVEHVFTYDPVEARSALHSAWLRAGTRFPVLEGEPVRAVEPAASRLLTWAGLTGVYSPFTGEPHVNAEIPPYARPFTVCHEIAHQRGIAREDEANFVAWLVCNESAEPYHRYSGNLMALSYALVAWHRVQPTEAQREFDELREDVRRDLIRMWEFWARRRTLLTQVARDTNDLFLKGQGQEAGAQSYGRMVDLMVAWRRRHAD